MLKIEETAEKFGERTAYITKNEKITYKELYERAKAAADLLRKQGTAPVLIYGNDGAEAVIAMAACLLAGRAYVPVSGKTPKERLRKILEISACSLVLTPQKAGSNLSTDLFGIERTGLEGLKRYENWEEKPQKGETAYIIFTSGTTGAPKGVPISRRNLENFIRWEEETLAFLGKEDTVVLNTAPLSFDLSVAAVYFALNGGRTLVSAFGGNMEDYSEIFSAMLKNRVNFAVMTPSFGRLCLLNPDFTSANYPQLRCVFFCGERLEKRTAEKLFERFPDIRIINAYGPTEATCAVSAIEITKEMLKTEEILPVGRAADAAVEIEIQNSEIVLKGESVFSGYLNLPSESCYNEAGVNCYKTGDMGYIDGGKLYCAGRTDSQIKYKGYRVELSEVESVLCAVPGVKAGAVIAKRKPGGSVKLIKAFAVAEPFAAVDYIKREMEKQLPDYMIPKTIVFLERLPVNGNGKTDRKALERL